MLDKALQKSVEDALAWEPGVDAAHIGVAAQGGVVTLHRKIEGALRRAATLDASRITVGIHDGKVTLAGTVHFGPSAPPRRARSGPPRA